MTTMKTARNHNAAVGKIRTPRRVPDAAITAIEAVMEAGGGPPGDAEDAVLFWRRRLHEEVGAATAAEKRRWTEWLNAYVAATKRGEAAKFEVGSEEPTIIQYRRVRADVESVARAQAYRAAAAGLDERAEAIDYPYCG
ncbi:hypothetical protein EBZ39_04715 [bacterium]|nr:hypothetical protein [bacterium]